MFRNTINYEGRVRYFHYSIVYKFVNVDYTCAFDACFSKTPCPPRNMKGTRIQGYAETPGEHVFARYRHQVFKILCKNPLVNPVGYLVSEKLQISILTHYLPYIRHVGLFKKSWISGPGPLPKKKK